MAEENTDKEVTGFQGQGGQTTTTPKPAPVAAPAAAKAKPLDMPDGGTGGGESKPVGDDSQDTNPATGKPWTTEEWRDKFRASASGAQELLTKVKTTEGERDTSNGKVAELTKKVEELTALAEGKNPEGLKASDLQAQLTSTTEKLALLTEKGALDDFAKDAPLAVGEAREALQSLARANPKSSLKDLWDNNLKSGAEATEATRLANEKARKEGAGDDGKGTSTREPAGNTETVKGPKGDSGLTQEEFDKLSVAERRKTLQKIGL